MMRLGILGGTFDPIHMGHLLMAEVTRETLQLERILFAPAGEPPHKQQIGKAALPHRQQMVALAIAENDYFELSLVDCQRPGPHYAVDTVRLIRAQYKLTAEECFFMMGSDSLADLPTWQQPQQLIQLCRLAVVHRPGYRPNVTGLEHELPGLTGRLSWVESPAINIAASEIRARIAAGQTIRYQVPESTRAYIIRHGLYQPE